MSYSSQTTSAALIKPAGNQSIPTSPRIYVTKLECPHCGREFMTEDALVRHIQNKHPEVS